MNRFKKKFLMTLLTTAALMSVCLSPHANDGRTKALPCTACHGPDGNSTLNREWPNLAGQHVDYMVAQLQAYKTGVRKNPNMNGMAAALSDQDMLEIAEFFSGQALNIASTDPTQSAAGGALYRGGNKQTDVPACMACHSPNGAGNPGAGYPALRGQHAKYTVLQLQAYRSQDRTTDAKEIMRTIASRMSTEEIENVAKFIEGLH
ncbi:MAG: cytochrome c4 [Gammaproteobacteria bacterium]|nr:cytochrome c4 [Gammaproteobacteria bacterium]